jgi:hypothetical protein
MTFDDFEWREITFDHYALGHKTHELEIAELRNFNGWYVLIYRLGSRTLTLAENIPELEAAKAIAAMHIRLNLNFEEYPDAKTFRRRAIKAGPKAFPKGVLGLGKQL